MEVYSELCKFAFPMVTEKKIYIELNPRENEDERKEGEIRLRNKKVVTKRSSERCLFQSSFSLSC